jgi:hypothetical protein
VQKTFVTFEKEYYLFEIGKPSHPTVRCRHVVRLTNEVTKPNADRLREYRESNLGVAEVSVVLACAIYPGVERVRLKQSLSFMVEQLGSEHPVVMKVFAGRSVKLVDELLASHETRRSAERKKLVEGGSKAVDDSRDPLIVFARSIDGEAAQAPQTL